MTQRQVGWVLFGWVVFMVATGVARREYERVNSPLWKPYSINQKVRHEGGENEATVETTIVYYEKVASLFAIQYGLRDYIWSHGVPLDQVDSIKAQQRSKASVQGETFAKIQALNSR